MKQKVQTLIIILEVFLRIKLKWDKYLQKLPTDSTDRNLTVSFYTAMILGVTDSPSGFHYIRTAGKGFSHLSDATLWCP